MRQEKNPEFEPSYFTTVTPRRIYKKGNLGDITNLGGLRPTSKPTAEPASSKRNNRRFHNLMSEASNGRSTIRTKYKVRKVMFRDNVNFEDPEEVKLCIARRKQWSNGHRIIACYAYNDYAKMREKRWEVPHYKKNETVTFVPTEKEIDALIVVTSKRFA